MTFWLTLNTVEQTVIVTASLVAFLAGALPTIAECVTHLAETLLAILTLLIGAAWPRFGLHAGELLEALRKQRRQIQRLRRRTKQRLREGAAA